jgi:hypothetical protein
LESGFLDESLKPKKKGTVNIITFLKEYNGVLSLFASIILGIWGINLTRKYGENRTVFSD